MDRCVWAFGHCSYTALQAVISPDSAEWSVYSTELLWQVKKQDIMPMQLNLLLVKTTVEIKIYLT